MSTSMQQCVVQGETDDLFVRVLDPITQAPITLSGTHTITLYSPGGSELVSATSTGVSTDGDHTISYTRVWTATTFPRSYQNADDARRAQRSWYRAEWSINTGTIIRQTYFEVIRRRFLSQLTDADFTARYPSVAAQLDSGLTTFATYRQRAWERIGLYITQRTGRNPGDLFLPETFSLCHEHWTLADFYLHNMFDAAGISEDRYKHEEHEAQGKAAFEAAMAHQLIDTNDDAIASVSTETYHLNGIKVRR